MKLKTWDGHNINDGTNYVAVLNANFYGLPGIKAVLGMRHGSWPILGGVERRGRELNFEIYIRSGSSLELEQWFDPEDETAKQLIAEDDAGGNDRYVYAICTELREVPFGAGLHYAVSLQIDGDVRWREIAITTASAWSITASGQTKVVDNNGQDKAYPILKIKPTGNKTGAWNYKVWTPVRWNIDDGVSGYPVDIVNNGFDTAALTTAKMQADGDDLRVWVDGIEVDRWLQDIDTSTTQVWCNLDFQARQEFTLDGAISNSVTTITVNEDISGAPSSGILYIDSEAIVYTSKVIVDKQFLGCTRGAKGTTAATHTDTTAIWWVQHDIWILYGNSTASAPDVDDDYKPAFLLSSTNASWDYDNFGDDNKLRSALWIENSIFYYPSFYTANRLTWATPWSEIGISGAEKDEGEWKLTNPCGITNVNFANGEKRAASKGSFYAYVYSSDGGSEYTIPQPSADATWEAWSYSAALSNESTWVSLRLVATIASGTIQVEASDVTLTLNGSNVPTTSIGSEQGNYDLSCLITNNTTGDAVELTFSMAVNDELEMDTDEKTIIFLDDDSYQFNALSLVGGPRKDWLSLDAGNNTLQFDDTGTGNVTITVTWWERWYQ